MLMYTIYTYIYIYALYRHVQCIFVCKLVNASKTSWKSKMWVQHWFIHIIWWHKHGMIWIEVLHKLSTVGVVWIELLQAHTYASTLFVQLLRSTTCLFHGKTVSWPFWTHARFALAIHLRFSSSILLGQDQQRGVWAKRVPPMVSAKQKQVPVPRFLFSVCLVTDLIDHLQGNRCGSRTISWKLLWPLLPQLVEKTVKIFSSVQVPRFLLVPTWGCYHWSPVVFISNILYSAAMHEK